MNDNNQTALQILIGAVIDLDPDVVANFWPDYKQHNPSIPNGAAAIAPRIPKLGANFFYEPGMAVDEGIWCDSPGALCGLGPKPMVAGDIFRVIDGKVAEHWDVMQEEVPVAAILSGNSMFSR
jgi:predicted SnoaL-like aldol condensation-catalyzing enzyme